MRRKETWLGTRSMHYAHDQWSRCDWKDEANSAVNSSHNNEIRRDHLVRQTRKAEKAHQRDKWTDDEPFSFYQWEDKIDSRINLLCAITSLFTDAPDYRTYRLVKRDHTDIDGSTQRTSKKNCMSRWESKYLTHPASFQSRLPWRHLGQLVTQMRVQKARICRWCTNSWKGHQMPTFSSGCSKNRRDLQSWIRRMDRFSPTQKWCFIF